MLDEQRVHASRGGLLPEEGPPEEHVGGGGLHPEELDEGPIIPDDVILDLNTRRLVPLRRPEQGDGPPPGEGLGPVEERARQIVRETAFTYPGAKEHVGLLPPAGGAPLFMMAHPKGPQPAPAEADPEEAEFHSEGRPVAQTKRVTDKRTGKVGHWATWHGTHIFIADDGMVYLGGSPIEDIEERHSIDAGVAKRREETVRYNARNPAPQVLGQDERPQSAGELSAADPAEAGNYIRVPGSNIPKIDGVKHPEVGFKAQVPGTEGRTTPLSRKEQAHGVQQIKARTQGTEEVFGGETKHGRVIRDFSATSPVRQRDVDRVLHYFDSASAAQRQMGEEWYPAARALAERWSALTQHGPNPLSVSQVAGIMAAASPQTPWDNPVSINNLQQAHDCIFYNRCHHFQDSPEKRPEKGHIPNPETGELRWLNPTSGGGKMQAVRDGAPVDQVLGQQKVWNFYLNIMGLKVGEAVTIDRHMMGVLGFTGNLTEAKYDQYARTIQAAARERGVPLEVMQAVAWVNYQQGRAPQLAAEHRADALAEQRRQRQTALAAEGKAPPPVSERARKGEAPVAPRKRKRKEAAPEGESAPVPVAQPAQRKAEPWSLRSFKGIPQYSFTDAARMNPQALADELISKGHYKPEQRDMLLRAMKELDEGGPFPGPTRKVTEAVRQVLEAYGPRPGDRGSLPPEPQAESVTANGLGLRRDRHTAAGGQKAEGEGEKRGWLTIRREVEGEGGKPTEEETHIYVGHDGTILQGPDHLKGRHLSDLRGEGSLDGQQRQESPEPYHSVGQQTGGGGGGMGDTGKVMRGSEDREMDTWLSHEKSKMLFQTEDHLNSLVRRGYMPAGEARAMLERAYADRAERTARAKGLGS